MPGDTTTSEPDEQHANKPDSSETRVAEGATRPAGNLIRRAQAARMLGVSKSTLRRMEGDALMPVVGPNNVRLFQEEQIQSMVVTRRSERVSNAPATGDVAAQVFTLFDEGVHPVDVVKTLRLDPDLVEGLHQRWCKLRGLLVLTETSRTRLHNLLCDDEHAPGPTNEAELLAVAERWVREESMRRCEQCRDESAAFCRTCAKTWGRRAARAEMAAMRSRRL